MLCHSGHRKRRVDGCENSPHACNFCVKLVMILTGAAGGRHYSYNYLQGHGGTWHGGQNLVEGSSLPELQTTTTRFFVLVFTIFIIISIIRDPNP